MGLFSKKNNGSEQDIDLINEKVFSLVKKEIELDVSTKVYIDIAASEMAELIKDKHIKKKITTEEFARFIEIVKFFIKLGYWIKRVQSRTETRVLNYTQNKDELLVPALEKPVVTELAEFNLEDLEKVLGGAGYHLAQIYTGRLEEKNLFAGYLDNLELAKVTSYMAIVHGFLIGKHEKQIFEETNS